MNYYLSEEQINHRRPYFPVCRGVGRVDDRRVISGIIHVLKLGLQWRDAPSEYDPHCDCSVTAWLLMSL